VEGKTPKVAPVAMMYCAGGKFTASSTPEKSRCCFTSTSGRCKGDLRAALRLSQRISGVQLRLGATCVPEVGPREAESKVKLDAVTR
jgi:hypothetical protein